jgi:hypothetical protein
MPRFEVVLKQSVEIYASLDVSAKDEETAREKVQAMIDNLTVPELEWTVLSSGKKSPDLDWDAPDGVIMEIDEVNEE